MQPGRLRAFIELMRQEVGNNDELIKQAVTDLNALDRQNLRNNFEARIEYAKQSAEFDRFVFASGREYGLQTLKWSFLMNAGAIAIVITFAGGLMARPPGTTHIVLTPLAIVNLVWPFAVGCLCVALAGAASYFNFGTYGNTLPTLQALHNFLAPQARAWPMARMQRPDELPTAFIQRYWWRVRSTMMAALGFGAASGFLFLFGLWRVLIADFMH